MKTAVFAVALLALPLTTLTPVVMGQREFFYRDVPRQYAPIQAQLDAAWERGEVPVWNASTQTGVPLWANLHAGVLAPWFPLFRWLPFSRAYGLAVLLCWWALGLGVFVWARRHVSELAALAAGLSASVLGVVLASTSYLPLLGGAACIPWQLAALSSTHRSRAAAVGALFALQILSGDPSTAVMGGLACLALLPALAPGNVRVLAAGALLGLGLSAMQWIPSLTLYGESARAGASLDARLAWSFHPARMLEWVVRAPFGQLLKEPFFERFDLAVGPDGQPFFFEHGWGVLPVLLLVPASRVRNRLRVTAFACVLLGIALSLGKYGLGGLHALPGLSFFRFPERYAVLTAFGAVLLTALGAHAFLSVDARARRRWAAAWVVAALVGAGAAFAGPPVMREPALTATTLVGLAGVMTWLGSARPRAALVGLLVLAWVEGVRATSLSVLLLPHAPSAGRSADPRDGRVWRDNASLRSLEPLARGAAGFEQQRAWNEATFASATPGLRGIDEVGGFSPVVLRRWQRVLQLVEQAPGRLAALFDACRLISTSNRAPGGTVLAPGVSTFEGPCLGRAWSVESAVAVASLDEALAVVARGDFDARKTATVEGAQAPIPALERRVVSARPRVRSSEISVSVEPGREAALVVVSESWAPGWTVQVDGEDQRVELLDGTLLGVVVRPTAREIRFVYEEPLLPTGVAVTAATALLLLGAMYRRNRRGQPT